MLTATRNNSLLMVVNDFGGLIAGRMLSSVVATVADLCAYRDQLTDINSGIDGNLATIFIRWETGYFISRTIEWDWMTSDQLTVLQGWPNVISALCMLVLNILPSEYVAPPGTGLRRFFDWGVYEAPASTPVLPISRTGPSTLRDESGNALANQAMLSYDGEAQAISYTFVNNGPVTVQIPETTTDYVLIPPSGAAFINARAMFINARTIEESYIKQWSDPGIIDRLSEALKVARVSRNIDDQAVETPGVRLITI